MLGRESLYEAAERAYQELIEKLKKP